MKRFTGICSVTLCFLLMRYDFISTCFSETIGEKLSYCEFIISTIKHFQITQTLVRKFSLYFYLAGNKKTHSTLISKSWQQKEVEVVEAT